MVRDTLRKQQQKKFSILFQNKFFYGHYKYLVIVKNKVYKVQPGTCDPQDYFNGGFQHSFLHFQLKTENFDMWSNLSGLAQDQISYLHLL